MNFIQKLTNATDIPTGKYSGYYWYSDSVEVEVVEEKSIDPGIFTKLPFVVEANFFQADKMISISVKHVDGVYYFSQVNLDPGSDYHVNKHVYESVIGKPILLHQIWAETQPMDHLADMKTMQPVCVAFGGFKTNV
ncbi:MAG: TIGR04423 family type III CRISPR-associated protein [Bacteroidota bacterium]